MPVLGIVVVGMSDDGTARACRPLAGIPTVARSVRALVGVAAIGRIEVLAPAGAVPSIARACSGLPVRVHDDVGALLRVGEIVFGAHGRQRSRGPEGDGSVTAGVVMIHDAARPLVPRAVTTAVVAAVRAGHRAVVPVLPLSDTVKQVDDDGRPVATPDRSGLRVVQGPQAFAAGLAPAVLEAAREDPVLAWTGAGGVAHTVPGDPLAFAVRDEWEFALAEAAIGAATVQEDR